MQSAAEERTAFVTGGSGFVGSALARRLVDEGWRVRGLARSDRAAAAISGAGGEPVLGDLHSLDALRAGADGCSVAFHAAARVADWGRRDEFERINVHGTRNVVEACREAGVRRFVTVSSEAAVVAGQPLLDVDETAPLRPDSKSPYSATKASAERIVLESAGDGFEPVAVRPRLVWGPGDPTHLPNFVEAVHAGRFAWLDGGRQRISTTHVDNAVEGLLLAAERGSAGEAYFITDGPPVEFRDFVTRLLATQGVEPPDRTAPARLARAGAAVGELVWRGLRLKGEPRLNRTAVWFCSVPCTIDVSKAVSELGYRPVVSIDEGMAALRSDTRVRVAH